MEESSKFKVDQIEQNPRVVVILGMHRSGTSMVGGVLDRLGVNLGEDYPGKQNSNPLGHFEDGDFLTMNIEILSAAGGTWDHPPSGEEILQAGKKFQPRIQNLIQQRMQENTHQLWGWKDPRTSLTIQLYIPFLDQPHVIWCQRNLDQIANSLQRRNNISHDDGISLSGIYQNRILEFLEEYPDFPNLVVDYQKMIDDPTSAVDKLIRFLGLDPTKIQKQAAVDFILPREKIRQKKALWWFRYLVSLPLRAIRRFWKLLS